MYKGRGRGRCAALVVEGGEVREGRRGDGKRECCAGGGRRNGEKRRRRRDADAALVVEGR